MRPLLADIFTLIPHLAPVESPDCKNTEESESSLAVSLAVAGHHITPRSCIASGSYPIHTARPLRLDRL